jgi:hypothetical protein
MQPGVLTSPHPVTTGPGGGVVFVHDTAVSERAKANERVLRERMVESSALPASIPHATRPGRALAEPASDDGKCRGNGGKKRASGAATGDGGDLRLDPARAIR